MANYYAKFLTNYFSVTNAEKFKALMASCQAEGEIEVFDSQQPDGSVKYGYGCFGVVHGIPDDGDEMGSLDALYEKLQELLPPNDAIIITEIGYEKLNYFVACCTVITHTDIQSIDIHDSALDLARKMLGNPEFQTKMDY